MKNLLFFIFSSFLLTPLNIHAAPNCPGRDLQAFRLSPVFFQGQRVKPFLLNDQKERYVPCSGQTVFLDPNPSKIIVGVETKLSDGMTKLHVVDYQKLLRDSSLFSNESPKSQIQLPQIILNQSSLTEGPLAEKERVLDLINQYNNTTKICQEINLSSFRLKTMLESWKSFCHSTEYKAECQKAMEVDMLSRTIAFEAHPLGSLDNIKDVLNTPIERFETSTCERVYIGVTLRNRKHAKVQKQTLDEKLESRLTKRELLSYSPYFYDGLDGRKYNIWLNQHVKRSYITSCFSHNIDSNSQAANNYNYKVFRKSYLGTIAHTYDVLFKPDELNRKISYINSQTQEEDEVADVIQHYYHPRAMPKCFYKNEDDSWKIRSNALGVIACRNVLLNNNKEVKDCALIKNEAHRYHPETKEIQWVKSNKKGSNLKYNWTSSEEFPWYAERVLGPRNARLYTKVENELDHTYSDLNKKRFRYCETFSNNSTIGNLAPGWALFKDVPRIHTVECRLDNQQNPVSLGGLEDPRIAPVVTKE